jgi:hypothetical protein
MDTNVPTAAGEHTRRLKLQEKARENLDELLKDSIGKPETKTDSLKITYKIPEGLQYPQTNTWLSNLVGQYEKILGVKKGISYEENKSSGKSSTVTITLTGEAFDKMGALQTLVAQQQTGRTP